MTRPWMEPVRYRPFGDTGLLLEYGHKISPDIHERVMAMTRAVRKRNINGLRAVIPTYASVLLLYEPALTNPDLLCLSIETLAKNLDETEMDLPRVVRIPVCYEGEFALDMADLSSAWGISPEEAIRIHSSRKYLIYMVGFTPGFAFLGGLTLNFIPRDLKRQEQKCLGGPWGLPTARPVFIPLTALADGRSSAEPPSIFLIRNGQIPFCTNPGIRLNLYRFLKPNSGHWPKEKHSDKCH